MKRLLIVLACAGLSLAACGDDEKKVDTGDNTNNDTPLCYNNPTTHLEIINACTDAEKIEKNPVLPLLNADGSLPELP